jgi:hypothetical protein
VRGLYDTGAAKPAMVSESRAVNARGERIEISLQGKTAVAAGAATGTAVPPIVTEIAASATKSTRGRARRRD